MKKTSYKTVDWSYPTSPNAERFGFADVGCWTAKTLGGPLAGFASPEEALIFAAMLDAEWAPHWCRRVPQAISDICEGVIG